MIVSKPWVRYTKIINPADFRKKAKYLLKSQQDSEKENAHDEKFKGRAAAEIDEF
jgi:hypothetical protein